MASQRVSSPLSMLMVWISMVLSFPLVQFPLIHAFLPTSLIFVAVFILWSCVQRQTHVALSHPHFRRVVVCWIPAQQRQLGQKLPSRDCWQNFVVRTFLLIWYWGHAGLVSSDFDQISEQPSKLFLHLCTSKSPDYGQPWMTFWFLSWLASALWYRVWSCFHKTSCTMILDPARVATFDMISVASK